MTWLQKEEVERILEMLRELGRHEQLIDLHTHGTEVIFDDIQYTSDSRGVLSVQNARYSMPTAGQLFLAAPDSKMSQKSLNQISRIGLTRAFHHIGPAVFEDHMNLCGLSVAVMLSVYRSGTNFGGQWERLSAFSNQSERLLLGYSIPNEVSSNDILAHLRDVTGSKKVAIVKIHPNLSSLDLSSQSGMNRVLATLEACNALAIPVLVHGGCSPILADTPASKFAALRSLCDVDWSLTKSPVVIAHFGAYGCRPTEIDEASTKALNQLLERNVHLYTDTSGVPYPVLVKMLGRVELDRVVFGSDALYVPMWHALAALAYALQEMHSNVEEAILQLASHAPRKILGARLPMPGSADNSPGPTAR